MKSPEKIYNAGRSDPRIDIYAHLPFFREIAKGNILEIGTRGGLSTAAFLLGVEKNGGRVYSVDIDSSCRKLFRGHPQWTFLHCDSMNPAGLMSKAGFEPGSTPLDILFIDGNHEEKFVKNDLAAYSKLVRSGGLILMHDVQEPEDKELMVSYYKWQPGQLVGPRRAFDEFTERTGWRHEIRPDSWGLGVIHVP